jgi:membrane protein insertase Oxa1/YidC/SpoIIIJ
MGFISWGFPMGLVLYFAVSNMFRVGQQAVIFRLDGHGDDDGKAKDASAPPEGPKKSGPSPHASKKRNRRRRK